MDLTSQASIETGMYHELFQRDKPDLAQEIKKVGKRKQTHLVFAQTEFGILPIPTDNTAAHPVHAHGGSTDDAPDSRESASQPLLVSTEKEWCGDSRPRLFLCRPHAHQLFFRCAMLQEKSPPPENAKEVRGNAEGLNDSDDDSVVGER